MTKTDEAVEAVETVRSMLKEILDAGGEKHPGIDAEIDAAHGLTGLERAQQALEKWQKRDVNGEWCTDNISKAEVEHRARTLANAADEVIAYLEDNDESNAAGYVLAALRMLEAVSENSGDWTTTTARLHGIEEALKRADSHLTDEYDVELAGVLQDVRELRDDVDTRLSE